MNSSGLTNKMLHDKYCYDAIMLYLCEGETREAMMKKFGGDLDRTYNFLRERSYEGMEIVERKAKPIVKPKVEKTKPKAEPNILDQMYDPPPMPEKEKTKRKKSSAKKAIPITIGTSGKQEELF